MMMLIRVAVRGDRVERDGETLCPLTPLLCVPLYPNKWPRPRSQDMVVRCVMTSDLLGSSAQLARAIKSQPGATVWLCS
jgi:hypothetical protein